MNCRALLLLGFLSFGAAESSESCDTPAETGTEAVHLIDFDSIDLEFENGQAENGADIGDIRDTSAPTPAPTSAIEYVVGVAGTNECPAGSGGLSEAECHSAPTELGGKVNDIFPFSRSSGPKLCFQYGARFYYNTHPTGSAKEGRMPICKVAAPTPAPTSAIEYVVGVAGTNECPAGSGRLSEAECHSAPTELGGKVNDIFPFSRSSDPKLCFKYGAKFYYNTHPCGSAKEDRMPICKVTSESDVPTTTPLCEAATTEPDAPITTPPPVVVGDPHVTTKSGYKLDLNQPGEYTLLQVPYDGPPLLRLEATVERSGMTCTFYVTKARFLGAWFHEDTIKIRAGTQDGWPFAIQMADAEPWATLTNISNNNETILKTYKHANVEVKVMAVRETTKVAASHTDPDGSFSVLVAKPGQPQAEQPIIKIAKGEHWLNVALTRLGHLGYSKLGGVLGTDVPNAKWTELPDDCKMIHELQQENFRNKDMKAELETESDASIFWY